MAKQKQQKKPSESKTPTRRPLSSFGLLTWSLRLLFANWKLFGGILLLYAIVQLLLVQGILQTDFVEARNAVVETLGNQWAGFATGLTLLSYLSGTVGGASSSEAGVYQAVLLLVVSLALIWTLRQVLAGTLPRIRDGFYRGMTPLIPFVLILLWMAIQTLPLLITSWLYGTLVEVGLLTNLAFEIIVVIMLVLLACVTIYWLLPSLFALYIVTLPDMTPKRALVSGRSLVATRRLFVVRRLLLYLITIILGSSIVLLPLIMFAPVLVPWVFYLLGIVLVGVTHTYVYGIYRGLLDE